MTTLQPLYNASSNLTLTALGALASDTNLLAGWQSDVFDNTTELADEVFISGFFATGASGLTAGRTIELWAYGSLDDAGTYPAGLTAAGQALKTLASIEVKFAGALARIATITTNATGGIVYPFQTLLGQNGFGFVPRKYGLWAVQNTGNTLAAAASMQITRTPLKFTNT